MVKSLVGIDKNEYDALRAENERLNKILKQEFNENDELGSEYLGITIVREENKGLKAENESLKVDNHTLKLKLEDIQATWGAVCGDLEAKLAIVTEALKFYSSEWRSDIYAGPTTELLNDFGKLATETLEKLQEQEAQREEK
jgi:hypothetical protein